MKRYVRLTKEYKDLEKLTATTRRYRALVEGEKEARAILETESDEDLRAMPKEESTTRRRPTEVEEEIKLLLIPPTRDSKKRHTRNTRRHRRRRGRHFCRRPLQMYTKYCESKGWSVAVSSFSEGAAAVSRK